MPQTLPTRYERRSSIASSTASQSPPPRTTSLPESPGSFRVERPSALMSRLNRLSNSTSRPNLPSPPLQEDSYTSRAANAMRSVSQSGKDVLRRTGLGAWAGGSSANNSLAVTEQDEQGEDDDFKPPLARSAGWPLPPHMSPQPPHLSPRINASASLDTSSILYATMSNHPPPLANLPLLVLNLAALAAVPTPVTNDVLLATVLRRLEPWVGDEGEAGYTLIVLAAEEDAASSHGKRRALPGVTWWIWNWRRIPRKYRKNLKRLYIVHPGTAAKTLLPITLPLLSPKSYPKLHIVPSLLALARAAIPLRGVDVPLSTLAEEARVLREHPQLAIPRSGMASFGLMNTLGQQGGVLGGLGWGVSAISSAIGTANSYLPFKIASGALPPTPEEERKKSLDQDSAAEPTKYWSGDLDKILADNKGHLPRVLHELRALILGMCSDTEGIFRRTATSHLLPPLQGLLDLPPKTQPRIDWAGVAIADPHLPPILFMRLLKGLSRALIPEELYPLVRSTYTPDEIRTNLLPSLSPASVLVLTHLTHIGHHLLAYEDRTRMGATNLAIVFAPSLISGQDPRVDAALCLEPGKSLPPSLMPPGWAESGGTQTLVGLLQLWISEWPAIAEFTVSKNGWCDCAWADAGGQLSASDPSTPIGMGRRTSGAARSGLYHELLGSQVMSSLAPATEAEDEAGVGAGLGYILNEDNKKLLG